MLSEIVQEIPLEKQKIEQQKFQDWLFQFREDLQMTLMTKLGFGLVSKNISDIKENHQEKFDDVGEGILNEIQNVDLTIDQENSENVLGWIEFGYSKLFAELFSTYLESIPNYSELKKIAETNEGRSQLLEKIEDEFAPKLYKQMMEEMKDREEEKAEFLLDEDVVEETDVA